MKKIPIFGIGFSGFLAIYGYYSHATVIEIPVSCGIIGSLIYFFIYFVSIRNTCILYKKVMKSPEFYQEKKRIKMIIMLWVAMLFYTICIVHIYVFDSFIIFGIIFGETSYIKCKLTNSTPELNKRIVGSKYIKTLNIKSITDVKDIGSQYVK